MMESGTPSQRWRGPGRVAATVNGNAVEAMATGEAKVFCCGLSNAIEGVAEEAWVVILEYTVVA